MARKRKPPQEYCIVAGCNRPGLVHLGVESYCLKHIHEKLKPHTHLDAIGTGHCKVAAETIQSASSVLSVVKFPCLKHPSSISA